MEIGKITELILYPNGLIFFSLFWTELYIFGVTIFLVTHLLKKKKEEMFNFDFS